MRDAPEGHCASRLAWRRLERTSSLELVARSRSGRGGWDGSGTATVEVARPDACRLVFTECGRFEPLGGRPLGFRNVFRWTLEADRIRLEHLRRGPGSPVHLLDLEADADGVWRSVTPHRCADDRYATEMHVAAGEIRMLWLVSGPSKDEELCYRYR